MSLTEFKKEFGYVLDKLSTKEVKEAYNLTQSGFSNSTSKSKETDTSEDK